MKIAQTLWTRSTVQMISVSLSRMFRQISFVTLSLLSITTMLQHIYLFITSCKLRSAAVDTAGKDRQKQREGGRMTEIQSWGDVAVKSLFNFLAKLFRLKIIF